MRVIITGGAGFIGSHIQDRLISLGHQVSIIDSLRSGRKENLHPKAAFFQEDIRRRDAVSAIFTQVKPQAVFHLAAQNEVPYSMAHPDEDLEMNIIGSLNIFSAALPTQAKIIYSNTGGAYYGEVTEDQLPLTEDTPVRRPTSYYGVSKATAELYLKLMGEIHHLPWVSLRYANVYGPRQAGNREAGIVAIFTAKLLQYETPTIFGDGLHTRDYVYVDDVVDANIAALTYPHNDYFNISTGTRTSNNQVFSALESVLKTKLLPHFGPDRPGDPRHSCLSPAKAAALLNWTPKTSFSQGVKLTVEYYSQRS